MPNMPSICHNPKQQGEWSGILNSACLCQITSCRWRSSMCFSQTCTALCGPVTMASRADRIWRIKPAMVPCSTLMDLHKLLKEVAAQSDFF